MKLKLLLLALLITGCSKTIKYSGNPVLEGWYADPEGLILNSKYWIFPTFSAPYEKQVFLDAFSSDDMISWTKHEHIIDTSFVKWAKKAIWAPSVIQNNNRYFLFFGANDIQSDNETGGIGIAVSDNPEGPYNDFLGKPLIDSFHNGAQPIDQFAFKDADGQYYLIYGGWKHCNIVKLKEDFSGVDSTFVEITPEGYVEGPFMFIRNNKYYFMWSEGGWTGPDYSVAYAISDSPFGPFKRTGKILQQDPAIATGAGHHSVINIPGTDEYYIIYHRRPLDQTDPNARVVCIDKMEFDSNGYIKQVVITNTGAASHLLETR
jgi:beta-xylosidase